MDLFPDTNKIANRKKITADAEKLRQKALLETENIIKIKVAQDTAYWDLKEKLNQLEVGRDRLQNNMVDVQMQYEAVSAQYQDELHRRPETLNKVNATHEICGALEEYVEQLRGALACSRADHAALADAYDQACREVRKTREDFVAAQNQARLESVTLSNKLKASEDLEVATTTAVREAEERCETLELQTRESAEQAERFTAALTSALADRDRLAQALLQERQKTTDLRLKREQNKTEFEIKAADMRHKIADLEQRYAEAQKLCDEEDQLLQASESRVAKLEGNLRNLQLEQAVAAEKAESVEKEVHEADSVLNSKEAEINDLIRRISALESEKTENLAEAQRCLEECERRILELTAAYQEAVLNSTEAQKRLDDLRECSEKELEELKATIDHKSLEVDAKEEVFTGIMTKINTESEAIARLEVALREVRETAQASAETGRSLQIRAESLEAALQEKNSLVTNLTEALRQSNSEKGRLQEQIQGLQNTIDDVQKKLKLVENLKQQDHKVDETASTTPNENRRRVIAELLEFLSDTSDDNDPKAARKQSQPGDNIQPKNSGRSKCKNKGTDSKVKKAKRYHPNKE